MGLAVLPILLPLLRHQRNAVRCLRAAAVEQIVVPGVARLACAGYGNE